MSISETFIVFFHGLKQFLEWYQSFLGITKRHLMIVCLKTLLIIRLAIYILGFSRP